MVLIDKEKKVISTIENILANYKADSFHRALDILTTSISLGMSQEGIDAINNLIVDHHKTSLKRQKTFEIENKVLKTAAFQDYLTGIPNRKYLNMYLDAVVKESEIIVAPVSLIAFDLDCFKLVNDIYGHKCGDLVLEKVKEILPNNLRGYDHVFLDKKLKRFSIDKKISMEAQTGREGGEEFYVVLPNTIFEEALIVGERLRFKTEQTFNGFFNSYEPIPTMEKREGMPQRLEGLTASIGVATTNTYYTPHGKRENILHDAKALKEAADLGNYLAKKDGRNRVRSVCSKN
ncbi:GGDEF domain-containing protein [Candidatus Woesearchaeota archaeon]|nr:GGDEF domain-containing protein [Candidatus Woesearchaeota archaeon]